MASLAELETHIWRYLSHVVLCLSQWLSFILFFSVFFNVKFFYILPSLTIFRDFCFLRMVLYHLSLSTRGNLSIYPISEVLSRIERWLFFLPLKYFNYFQTFTKIIFFFFSFLNLKTIPPDFKNLNFWFGIHEFYKYI